MCPDWMKFLHAVRPRPRNTSSASATSSASTFGKSRMSPSSRLACARTARISVPLVKEVFASGLTPMQLEDILTQKLRQYINNPVVTVIVLEVRSQRVFIVGNVGASGMLPLEPGLTAMRAIALAGGLTEFAKRKKIYVLREVAGKPQKIPFDYSGVLSGETPEADIELKPGDTIFVP
ncbi:MAG: polysaccharide biosynthesis/export family protein [Bryobacterales bacterium]